ncbi:MAG TPA: zf-HC2 domain-containing protein [Gemmataceae bacterium]
MTCREMVELLIDFCDGSLPEDQRRLLEQHLCDCPPCADYLQTYRVTIRLTRLLPRTPLPAEFEDRLRRFLQQAAGQ